MLFYGNFSAANGLIAEKPYFTTLKVHDTITHSMNSKVTTYLGAFAGAFCQTYLTYDNLSGADFLPCIELNAKALTWAIVNVFGDTASFYV
jgi:hypothetical protein